MAAVGALVNQVAVWVAVAVLALPEHRIRAVALVVLVITLVVRAL